MARRRLLDASHALAPYCGLDVCASVTLVVITAASLSPEMINEHTMPATCGALNAALKLDACLGSAISLEWGMGAMGVAIALFYRGAVGRLVAEGTCLRAPTAAAVAPPLPTAEASSDP